MKSRARTSGHASPMRATLLTLSLLLLAAAPPDRISGTWQADLESESKTATFVFDFKATGNALTGTVELVNQERSFPITNGTVAGNSVAFTSAGRWTGTLSGAELKLTRELDYGKKQQMTAHRIARQ